MTRYDAVLKQSTAQATAQLKQLKQAAQLKRVLVARNTPESSTP
jgi:hypothetical protein